MKITDKVEDEERRFWEERDKPFGLQSVGSEECSCVSSVFISDDLKL